MSADGFVHKSEFISLFKNIFYFNKVKQSIFFFVICVLISQVYSVFASIDTSSDHRLDMAEFKVVILCYLCSDLFYFISLGWYSATKS